MRTAINTETAKFSFKIARWTIKSWAIAFLFQATLASALPINVTIDTSGLSGSALLAFDLTDGDFSVDNSAVISNFMLTGATLGSVDAALTSTVGLIGSLPTGLTLAEDLATITVSHVQGIDFSGGASSISFQYDLSTNVNPGFLLDSFAFSLLDISGIPLISTDLFGILLLAEVDGSKTGAIQIAQETTPNVSVSASPASVPEPTVFHLTLIGWGLGLFALGRKKGFLGYPTENIT